MHLNSQAVFLQQFPAVYGELLKLFTVREVAAFVRETLGSLPTASQADCPLEAVKLHCITKTVESQIYINPGKHAHLRMMMKIAIPNFRGCLLNVCVFVSESRCILLPVVLRLLQAHLQEQRDLVMCAHILTCMLSLLKKDDAVR